MVCCAISGPNRQLAGTGKAVIVNDFHLRKSLGCRRAFGLVPDRTASFGSGLQRFRRQNMPLTNRDQPLRVRIESWLIALGRVLMLISVKKSESARTA